MNELPIPPTMEGTADAQEILRAWMQDDGLHVSLFPSMWPQPEAWGIVLADVVRHLADAYHQGAGIDPSETAQQVLMMLLAEFQSPTDEPSGAFVGEQ